MADRGPVEVLGAYPAARPVGPDGQLDLDPLIALGTLQEAGHQPVAPERVAPEITVGEREASAAR